MSVQNRVPVGTLLYITLKGWRTYYYTDSGKYLREKTFFFTWAYCVEAGLIDTGSGRDTFEVILDEFTNNFSCVWCWISISMIRMNFRTCV